MFKRIAITLLLAGPALGANDEAWSEFATEVEDTCLVAVGDIVSDASVVVDPFGSESYGLAIVSGRTADDGAVSVICVFDKITRTVEIGGELAISVMQQPQ